PPPPTSRPQVATTDRIRKELRGGSMINDRFDEDVKDGFTPPIGDADDEDGEEDGDEEAFARKDAAKKRHLKAVHKIACEVAAAQREGRPHGYPEHVARHALDVAQRERLGCPVR